MTAVCTQTGQATMERDDGAPLSSNLLDFLGWIAARPRTYAETMEAWRTSCPRLTAWEDATGSELVRLEQGEATTQGRAVVRLTEKGTALLNGGK
jgi:hypothetical protein